MLLRKGLLTRQARATIAKGLRCLVGLRLLTRIKRRVRFSWCGGIASRQAANGYVLHQPTEFSGETVYRGQRILITHPAAMPSAAAEAAKKALAAIAERRRWLQPQTNNPARRVFIGYYPDVPGSLE